MRIAFLTTLDPYNRRSWSGILYYMLRALERHCGEVISLGPAGGPHHAIGKLFREASRIFAGKKIDYRRTVAMSKALGRIFDRRLSGAEFDLIFAPAASIGIAFLESKLPLVRFEDVTARVFRDYAANLEGLSPWSLRQCEIIEARALERADRSVFASEWAARSAIEDYHTPESKVRIIPMGANLDEIPGSEELMAIRSRNSGGRCRLLFVGVDWQRKGGDIAVATMLELRRRGLDVTLTVVGCRPPSERIHAGLRVIPFLNKNKREDQQELRSVFLDSDFMIFPTRRDASPIVCCEASAFGLPQLVSDVGGLPVQDGVNGFRLPLDASASEYADVIQRLLADRNAYLSLVRSARALFETRLNWDAWGRSMASLFDEILQQQEKGAEAVFKAK